jgi:hypothetical protein
VVEAATSRTAWNVVRGAGALLLALLAFAGAAGAAVGPYEPNDSIAASAGPLGLDQTYSGAIETSGDRDVFSFHVTAPSAEVKLTIRNLGGGQGLSDVDVAVVNALGTPLESLAYINDGEGRTLSVTLPAQKYYVEVWSNEGFGDSYTFTTGGGAGAFGPYAQVAARCGAATSATKAAKGKLSRAETRLQRATNRVRRSRYASRQARARAQALKRQAEARLSAERKAVARATASQQPWCSIPQ